MLTNIEAERGRKGVSKEKLSQLLGITSKTYRAYINGASIPSDVLISMSNYFDCSIDYLVGRSERRK